MKIIVDGLFPIHVPMDYYMNRFEHEALPFRDELEYGPVEGNFYRVRGEPDMVAKWLGNRWQFWPVEGIKDPK